MHCSATHSLLVSIRTTQTSHQCGVLIRRSWPTCSPICDRLQGKQSTAVNGTGQVTAPTLAKQAHVTSQPAVQSSGKAKLTAHLSPATFIPTPVSAGNTAIPTSAAAITCPAAVSSMLMASHLAPAVAPASPAVAPAEAAIARQPLLKLASPVVPAALIKADAATAVAALAPAVVCEPAAAIGLGNAAVPAEKSTAPPVQSSKHSTALPKQSDNLAAPREAPAAAVCSEKAPFSAVAAVTAKTPALQGAELPQPPASPAVAGVQAAVVENPTAVTAATPGGVQPPAAVALLGAAVQAPLAKRILATSPLTQPGSTILPHC